MNTWKLNHRCHYSNQNQSIKLSMKFFSSTLIFKTKKERKEKASLQRVRSRISRIIGWRKRERSAKKSGSFRDFSFLPRYSWILVSTRNVDERKLELHVEESGSLVFETDRVDEFPE